jgi:hypothetical protein
MTPVRAAVMALAAPDGATPGAALPLLPTTRTKGAPP